MTPIAPAALAVMTAAAEDYRILTPPDEQTPAGLADYQASYLLAEGYAIRPAQNRLSARWSAARTTRAARRHRRRIRRADERTALRPTPDATNEETR
ncbi:hypothetical protein [Streptomyces youssoufiensis]